MQQFNHQNHSSSILITAGGTGGHVIPAHVLSEALSKLGYTVHFVIDSRAEAFIDSAASASITVLPLPRYQGNLLQKIKFIAALFISTYQCWQLIRRHNINTVIGFGGYITAPALIAARLNSCRIILHEQNTVLGRVNRFFGYFADKIILSTRCIQRCVPRLLNKCVTLGLPIRPKIAQSRHIPPTLYPDQSTGLRIFVIGGSQAAAYFSDIMPKALALLPDVIRDRLQIHQQCRFEDWDSLQQTYKQLNIKAELKIFFDDMPAELIQADLIFARAGASTIAEISAVGKPAFFIPFPHALDDHQSINATMTVRFGGGWWQPQSHITPVLLSRFLQYIVANPCVLMLEGEAMRSYSYPHATDNFVDLIKNTDTL